jgi:hypothetical protein
LGWGYFCSNLRHGSGGAIAFILLATLLWGKAWKEGGRLSKILLGMGLIISALGTLSAQIQTTAPYASCLGVEDPSLRLKRNYSFEMSTFDAYRALEDHSDSHDRVLAFGVFQTYPLQRISYVDFYWKKPTLLEWASPTTSAQGLALKLEEEGVEYILYQRQEAVLMSQREKGFALEGIPEDQYVEFWKNYAQPQFVSGNVVIYRIRTKPATRPYPLLELPGLQERIIFDVKRSSNDKSRIYNELEQLLKSYPDWRIGKELEKNIQAKNG